MSKCYLWIKLLDWALPFSIRYDRIEHNFQFAFLCFSIELEWITE